MRHSRSHEFARALAPTTELGRGRWSDLGSDPNGAVPLTRRADVLRAAWRPPLDDRIRFLEDRCRDHRVLDIGCVAHDVARMDASHWLHGRLAAVASECIGVDVLAEAACQMEERGYRVVIHDLSTGPGPLADEGLFDVIVAGELIEHVGSIDMLFETAAALLTPTGSLIVTTPNPYAPRRVRAAQLGIVWENVDHILYAFPSGMAELAERHGLVLSEAMVTGRSRRPSLRERIGSVRRRVRGTQFVTVGIATVGERRVAPVRPSAWDRLTRGQRFVGETFVYVVTRSGEDPRLP